MRPDTMNTPTPSDLATLIHGIKQSGEQGAWQEAAELSDKLQALIRTQPVINDRQALEAMLADIAAILERAEPLQHDLQRLLKAFD